MTGEELETLRVKAGISRRRMAELLGLSERRVYGIERSTRTHVTEDLARRWAEAIKSVKKTGKTP